MPSPKPLTLTRFHRLRVGKLFYVSNDRKVAFKKTSKDTWCLVLKNAKGKIIKTRDNKISPDDLVGV